MLRYREGDLQAFKELYLRHCNSLYAFIDWRSPRKEWVNEVVQDTWTSLHRARSRYEPSASFKTFLYQIARNRLIDLIRQQSHVVLATDLGADNDNQNPVFDSLADMAYGCNESPEDVLERKQSLQALREAVRALPADQREALVLQQFNEMSLDEIAVIQSVPAETVKSRLRYAMQKLRRQFENAALQGELS